MFSRSSKTKNFKKTCFLLRELDKGAQSGIEGMLFRKKMLYLCLQVQQ